MSFQPGESGSLSHTDRQTHPLGVSLPAFAVLTSLCLTDTVVLVQGAELGAGGREAVFFISTLEAGKNTLTKQILLWLHLQEMVETYIAYVLLCHLFLRTRLMVSDDYTFSVMLCSLFSPNPKTIPRSTFGSPCAPLVFLRWQMHI